ncbi:MAG TPA: aminotransferase class I/II-fold pyridoxal phosphate-dependent enzyme [Ktedonobacteraceae bacterium]|jgi:aspartate aminotransferase/aminotransferase|nr:aminotransferase class I/II-fold pyridoxal phosphate-dependent enzyme [Ktedonobacteraceae bacterium]
MKTGKQRIYELGANDITSLGVYAAQLQREAAARGVTLPPAVRLQIGEPSFRTPQHICRAAIESISNEAQTYAPAEGWPWLRELIAARIARVNGYSVGPENVAIAQGGTGALMTALTATVERGDEVLIPDPCWSLYFMQLAACGATGVPYPLDPQNEWLPDMERLERLVTPRTRLLLINTPGNPTGGVFPAQVVSALLDFARRHDLYLLADECYDEIIFEGQHVSPGTMLSRDEFEAGRFIGVYSFSKTYAMTGWRIGYLVTGTRLMKTMGDVLNASYTNIATMVQRAAAAALTGPQDCVAEMRASYRRRRDLAVSLLKEMGRYIYTPHGAFYVLIDVRGKHGEPRRGRQFALDLLRERNVAVASGSGFGSVSQDYVRISLGASEEEIERGVREICLFADRS